MTPQAYSCLAWACLKSGETDKALQIAKAHVERKSCELEVVYRLGVMYKNSGNKSKAKKYRRDARDGCYELDPLAAGR